MPSQPPVQWGIGVEREINYLPPFGAEGEDPRRALPLSSLYVTYTVVLFQSRHLSW